MAITTNWEQFMKIGTIGVGIIGVNAERGWASTAHIPALRALDGYEIRALSSSKQASADAVRAKFGVAATYASHEELVTRQDVDLVVVTVKAPNHFDLVTAALNAGKAVYCEWPLGSDLDEARQMAELATKQQANTIIGLQARLAPQIEYARDLVAANYVGEVLSTTMFGLQSTGGTVAPANVYMMDNSSGANLLTVSVGHSLDALSHVLGELESLSALTAIRRPHVRVEGTNNQIARSSADQIAVLGQLESHATASLHIHEGSAGGTGFLWEIHGSDGTLRITADWSLPEIFPLTISGATGKDEIAELVVPATYLDEPAALTALTGQPAYNVGRVYASYAKDLKEGTHATAGFAAAVSRHEVIAAIEEAAVSGDRVRAHPARG
jgi:predicted dehydrogenase